MAVARTVLDEWLERADRRLLAAWYLAASARAERVRGWLRAERAAFIDPRRAAGAAPVALVEVDRTARRLVQEAADRAGRRSALAGLVGAASLPGEVVAATIAAVRLGQRLCVVYGLDPETDRGGMALCQALAAAYEVDLPDTGPADLRVTDLPALVGAAGPTAGGPARLTRAMAAQHATWATTTRRRWLPVLGSRLQAEIARERTLTAGRRIVAVLQRICEMPGSTRDHVEDAVEVTST